MTKTLAQLIDLVQEQLGDATRYPDAACTTALRQALSAVNLSAPRQMTGNVSVVSGQYEYAMSGVSASAMSVLGVSLSASGKLTRLGFSSYVRDGALYFRLQSPLTSGTMSVVYTLAHTVNGLDSAATSTLAAWENQVIVDGGCRFACLNRVVALAEEVNVNPAVLEGLNKSAALFDVEFTRGLGEMRKASVQGQVDTTAAAGTLASFIEAVQGQLLDDGTRYPDAACTMALRQALAMINRIAPLAVIGDAVASDGALIYQADGFCDNPISVLDVFLKGESDERNVPLPFDSYWESGVLFFRLRSERTSSDALLVVCAQAYELGASSTTLPERHYQVLVDGACAFACAAAAAALVNDPRGAADLRTASAHFNTAFILGMGTMAKERPTVGERSTAAWNDPYYRWDV